MLLTVKQIIMGILLYVSEIYVYVGITKLTSIISPSNLSMLSVPEIPEFGYVAIIGLISLLSFKEVMPAFKFQEKALESSLTIGIAPLLVSFIAIIAYKIAEIL